VKSYRKRLSALVVEHTGFTDHRVGVPERDDKGYIITDREGKPVGGEPITQKIKSVEILEDAEPSGGWSLFYFDKDGNFLTDTWHMTLEEAKEQAYEEFRIPEDAWTEIP